MATVDHFIFYSMNSVKYFNNIDLFLIFTAPGPKLKLEDVSPLRGLYSK